MTDEVFIEGILQKGKEANEKVQIEFSGISIQQLNWKPSEESWSIAQCLDHLIVSDSSYFSVLEKITDGNYQMNLWESYSPFTGIWGRIMKDQLQEQVKRKLNAPKKFRPAASKMPLEIIERYHKNLERFLELISNCRNIDIDKTIISSPATRIVTYSLRDALNFLMQHEHRHINQAVRIKSKEDFPKQELCNQ